jgi:hypothetical protein
MHIAIAIKHMLFTMPEHNFLAEPSPSPSMPDLCVRLTERLFDTGSFASDAGSQSESLAALATRVHSESLLNFMRSTGVKESPWPMGRASVIPNLSKISFEYFSCETAIHPG